MSRWLRRQVRIQSARADNPGVRIVHLLPVAFVVSLLGLTPALTRIDAPLADLVLASLPREEPRAEIVIVDLESWSLDSIPQRAESRRQIAALVDLLAGSDDRAVGLDVLLVDPTAAEADSLLVSSLETHPAVVMAASVETHELDGEGGAIPPLLLTDNPRGWIHVVLDARGRVHTYGLPGRLHDSLAGQLARQIQPGLAVPPQPALVQAPRDPSGLAHRWAVLPAAELLTHPEAVATFPSPAVVLIGLAGDRGGELDGHLLRGSTSGEPIPGILLHALVVEEMLTGRLVVEGGWEHHLAAVFLFLCATLAVGRGVRWIRRRRSPAVLAARPVGVAGAAGMMVLALPFAVVFTGLTGAGVSVAALILAPPALLASARVGAAVCRRMRFRRALRIGGARLPTGVAGSLRMALLEESASARLASVLDAYEDLVYTLVVLLLATREFPRRPARVARDLWHRQHTLPTVLATFATLEPDLGERIGGHSRCAGDPEARRWLAEHVGMDGTDTNGFVAVRNALAHDTTALWLTEDTASVLCAILRRQLLAILCESGVEDLLRGVRIDERPPASGEVEPGEPRPVQLEVTVGGDGATDAGPWLVWLASEEHRTPRLFRYRGLARRKDWIAGANGPARSVTYTPFGADHRGERSEVCLGLSRVTPQMPPWMRMDHDGEG